MQTKNFKGQDLRGRSFKNQDLTGADFSDCDLRGVDFSFANLTDAKFCNARMGKFKRKLNFHFFLNQLNPFNISDLISSLLVFLGLISVFMLILGNSLILWVIKKYFVFLSIAKIDSYNVIFLSFYSITIIIGILLAINYKKTRYSVYFFVIIPNIIALIPFFYNGVSIYNYIKAIGLILVYILTTLELIIFLLLSLLAKPFELFIISYLFGFFLAISPYFESFKFISVYFDAISVSLANFIYILFVIYLRRRVTIKEEPQLLLIRNFLIKTACFDGTEFDFTTLQRTDFSNADLKYVRFKNAKISNCNFKISKNHHLALFENTPLEPRKVRDLVIDGIITDKNFATLDLRGLDFSNLNLQNFDFSHANLSGANLSHTQLTGATLEGWNIDTETRLDDIDCRYYYYLENGAKKRMPPEGEEYSPGEFTRIFQKIANTIDFIAHNEMELAAIKLSVEQVRVESGNDDIRVQAIEEKDGFIVVKVTVPKTEDRGVLYHELKQKIAQVQLRLRDKTHRIKELRNEIDDLKNKVNEKRQDLYITAGVYIEGNMNGGNVAGNDIHSPKVVID